MAQLGLFVFEVFFLYLVSRRVLNRFYSGIYFFTRSKRITLYLFALFFWFGTLIHELSHYLVASLLGVKVDRIRLTPRFIDENRMELGSVRIAKPNPLSRFLIGVSPMIIGIFLIVFGVNLGITRGLFESSINIAVFGYIVFAVGNTMFSSKQDMEGTWMVLLVIVAIMVSFWILGASLNEELAGAIFELASFVNKFLLIPIVIDLALLGLFYTLARR